MRFPLALLLTLLLAACASEPEAPEPAPDPTAAEVPGLVPADSGRVGAGRPGGDLPLTVREPGEVVRLDPAQVLTVTLPNATLGNVNAGSGMELILDGEVVPADEAAVRAWLARYDPLEAAGRYDGLDPRRLYNDPDLRVSFGFDDGSSRTVAFTRRGDSLAVVSQLDGPVFRLPAGRLAALVPDPATFRGDR